jgi:HEAT repeat protein
MIRVLVVLAMTATPALAQQSGVRPPVPPLAQTPPPSPSAKKPPRPPALDKELKLDLKFDTDLRLHLDDLRLQVDGAQFHAQQSIEQAREEMARARDEMARAAEQMRLSWPQGQWIASGRPESRFPQDPADSLYRQARMLFNNGDYRAAAQRFREVQQKFPNSNYIVDAMYYQAYSLYRAGSDAELREALAVLDAQRQKFPDVRRPEDGSALATRIRGELARRGDSNARAQLTQDATGSSQRCDREEQSVRAEALSALMRTDPDGTMPMLDRVLARRDDCSEQLRRSALQILGRRGDEKAIATLISTAKNDPSTSLRVDALDYLSRFTRDDILATYESLSRESGIESVRRAAARNLAGYPAPRARQIARALVEDNSVPDNVRVELIDRYRSERITSEDGAWMRGAYPKVTSERVKRSLVSAIARAGGADNQKWLMELSSNDQEPSSLRASAFSAVSTTMSVAELSKTYDNAGARSIRLSVVRALAKRKEPEAVDKLIDVVRRSTDPDLRREVIGLLTEKKDPKVTAMLLELIDR